VARGGDGNRIIPDGAGSAIEIRRGDVRSEPGGTPFAILSVESPGLDSVVGVAMSQLFEAAGKVSFGDGVITPDGLRQLRRRVHPAPKSLLPPPWRGGIFVRSLLRRRGRLLGWRERVDVLL
jgi:hypothetical protein